VQTHTQYPVPSGSTENARVVDRPLWVLISVSVASIAPLLAMPVIVGALQDYWGYSASTAGYVSSAELLGMFIASVVTSALADRIRWRAFTATSLVFAVVLNLLSIFSRDPTAFAIARFAAGTAAGLAYAASLTLLSRTRDYVRSFAFSVCAQVICNALILEAFPRLIARAGVPSAFAAIAAITLISAVLVLRWFSSAEHDRGSVDLPIARGASRRSPAGAWTLCLISVACFYVTIGGYWAYCERIGLTVGLSLPSIHRLLSVGVLLSAAGCLAALWLSRRVGQAIPLLLAVLVLAGFLAMSGVVSSVAVYVVTLGIVQVCWNFFDILQLGTLAQIEPSGRAAALVPAAQGFALAVGPSVAATVLRAGIGYRGVLVLCAIFCVLAAACYWAALLVFRTSSRPNGHRGPKGDLGTVGITSVLGSGAVDE
jgi:DHA1 family inner membrane transport protein